MAPRWLLLVVLIGCDGADQPDDKGGDDTDLTDPPDTDLPDTDPVDTDPVDTALPDTADTDGADTDWPDDTAVRDTSAPVAEVWPHTPLPGPFVAPRGLTPGTWWITDGARFTDLLGAAAPPELLAGTHAVLVWYAGDRPWLSAWATIDEVRSWAPGSAEAVVTRHQLDPACSGFTQLLPVVAAALVPLPTTPVTQAGAVVANQTQGCLAGPTEGMSCAIDAPCAPGNLCASLTSPWAAGAGLCVEATQRGAFPIAAATIPDGDPAGVSVNIDVSGLATVTLDTLLELDLRHPTPEELHIRLTNPATSEAVVWDGWTTGGGSWTLRQALGFPADESIHGIWQLTLIDDTPGNAGQLNGGSLELLSQWD